jgi:membrane dipeptidase
MVGECTTGFPDWRAGGFGILFATIFVIPTANAYPGYTRMAYSTLEQAALAGQQELEFYHLLTSQDSSIKLIKTRQDLSALKTERQAGKQTIGLVLVMEGADPLIDPGDLQIWYDSGLRIIGPAWHATRYAGGTSSPGPLTDLGYRLLDEMASFNMLLDLSHIAEQAFYQAVEAYEGPIIASHSSPRHFVDGDRFLSDDMIRKVVERQGVIGVSLYNAHLVNGWRRGNARPSLARVAEVVDYMVQLTGSTAGVALGTDMDGGFGLDSVPQEIDTAADVGLVGQFLIDRGYSGEDIQAILMKNWLRVLELSLPE